MGTRVSQTEWLRPFGGYWVAGEGHERLLSLNNTLYLPVWVPRSGGGGAVAQTSEGGQTENAQQPFGLPLEPKDSGP